MKGLGKKAQATRRALLEAAKAELLENEGGLEVHRVAERAGMSVGLIYRYFGSRGGLIAAVVEEFYDAYDAYAMEVNPAPGEPWSTREKVRTQRVVEFFYSNPLSRVVLVRLRREPEVAAVEVRRLDRHVEAAAANIAHGQKRGVVAPDLDPRLLGALLLGGMRQVICECLSRQSPPPPEVLAAMLWGFIEGEARVRKA